MLEIVIDIREHVLIEKLRGLASESNSNIGIAVKPLLLGDILIRTFSNLETDAESNPVAKEILLFERKSFADLLASIKDGRYEEQSHRLIHSSGMNPHNIVYVLEGMFSTLRNPADKRVILSAMTSLSYFKGFSVFRTATILETAELIWAMANKLQKEFDNGREVPSNLPPSSVNPIVASTEENIERTIEHSPAAYSNFVKKAKRENITPENIGEIMLCQIPGISSHIAAEVLKHFGGSFTQLISEIKTNPEKLEAVYLESAGGKKRKLSSAVIKSILLFL